MPARSWISSDRAAVGEAAMPDLAAQYTDGLRVGDIGGHGQRADAQTPQLGRGVSQPLGITAKQTCTS
jgi:hypothetical protein